MTLTYQTSRLSVVEISSGEQQTEFLDSVTKILTPNVVENLPPYFHNVTSLSCAQDWFNQMVSESRLLMVNCTSNNTTIGFVFVSATNNSDAHIGYLLGEAYWGKGLATELVKGLIDAIITENKLKRLIAGVDTDNTASAKLLLKLGFIKKTSENNNPLIYEYLLLPTSNVLKKKE
ncbi:GNAT family N-acetyltransferase [Colwelliaceae bacterium 6441]